ncbi:hypothetical protein QBC45DRAFT_62714 [Copromyces sp. CBS 386.78]|nr:hypothetical protein QBC45DRAFT_62714 [Copromyces sp. CBS 386.78]
MRSSTLLAALGAAGLVAAQTTITSLVPVSTIVLSSPASVSSTVVTVTPSATTTGTTTTVFSSPTSSTSSTTTSTSTSTSTVSSVPSAAAGKVPLQGPAVGLGVFAALGMALL